MDDNPFSNPFDQNDHSNDDQNTYASNTLDTFEDGSNNRRLIWLLSGVILLGCGFIFTIAFFYFQPDAKPLIAQYFPSPTPTATATLTPTATLTFTPTNTYTPTPNMTAQAYESTASSAAINWHELVSENFDTNEKSWYAKTNDSEYSTVTFNVTDGKYVWDATSKKGFIYWMPVNYLFSSDFYISLEATQDSFTTAADYGIYFRADSAGNFYYFSISNKGVFNVWLNYLDKWSELIEDTKASTIRPREANKLAVLAEGDHFVFFINDQYVAECTDATIKTGKAGMAIEIFDPDLNIVFEFDNILLKRPE